MRFSFKLVFAITLVSFFNAHSMQTWADALPEPWETQREAFYMKRESACAGDARAISEIKQQISNGDAVAMNGTWWLKKNCEAFSYLSQSEVDDYGEQAATNGYPIAMLRLGIGLVVGAPNGEDSIKRGLQWMEKSAEEGYGISAWRLAELYSSGNRIKPDLKKARKFLEIAKAEGVSEERISSATQQVESAEAKIGVSDSSTDSGEQFAALAVSIGDGGFGFAHDYPDATSASERALEECKSRGGADCDVKMIGQGKGCMAYHSAGSSATAFGWAIGADQFSVESRAAQECSQRNGGVQCANTSWVCNDRTNDELEVVLNKPLPQTENSQCLVLTNLRCDAFVSGKARDTHITGASRQLYSLANCDKYDRSILGWSLKNNSSIWEINKNAGTGFSANEKEYFKSVLKNFKDTAIGAFPACTTPEYVSIQFFAQPFAYDIHAKPEYWKKVITYTVP